MNPMIYLAIILAIYFVIMIIYSVHRELKIMKSGIEVEAVVTSVSYLKITEGARKGRRDYFTNVEYVGDDNEKHEATLNCNAHFSKGTKLKVKYLPGKYNHVVLIVK